MEQTPAKARWPRLCLLKSHQLRSPEKQHLLPSGLTLDMLSPAADTALAASLPPPTKRHVSTSAACSCCPVRTPGLFPQSAWYPLHLSASEASLNLRFMSLQTISCLSSFSSQRTQYRKAYNTGPTSVLNNTVMGIRVTHECQSFQVSGTWGPSGWKLLVGGSFLLTWLGPTLLRVFRVFP